MMNETMENHASASGMKGMTIEQMARACEAQIVGQLPADSGAEATAVVTDSRQLTRGALFVALPGARVDGHDFIRQAFAEGALAVVCEHVPEGVDGPCLVVPSTRAALRSLAAYYLDQLQLPVVGITGSVGKTSTKEMIASVLSQHYCVHKTAGNFNNEIGLPLTIFGLRREHEVAVLEMGISDFGEMSRLAAIARPNVAVITNIGVCHLENLGSRDGILQAKTEMLDYLKDGATVVLNGDDDKLCTIEAVQGKAPVFYGLGETKPQGARYESKDICAENVVDLGLRGVDFDLCMNGGVSRVHIAIPGMHNVYNAMAAAAVGRSLGLSVEEICAGIEAARTIDGRTNLIETNGYLVIDDCYNANPVSMRAAIDVLAQAKGRKIAVLGDMGELGEKERSLHYEVGAYLAAKHIDWLFAAGTLSEELVRGVEETPDFITQYDYFKTDTDALLSRVRDFVQPGDTVLIKASHFMNYPRIVRALTEKENP